MAEGIDNATNMVGGLIGLGILSNVAGRVFDNGTHERRPTTYRRVVRRPVTKSTTVKKTKTIKHYRRKPEVRFLM